MPNSIYDQLSRGLGQVAAAGGRSILYRGQIIPCAVQIGESNTKLGIGGLDYDIAVNVKIQRELVPLDQGEPHTNEFAQYPAVGTAALPSKNLMIFDIIADEFSYSFKLVDPNR